MILILITKELNTIPQTANLKYKEMLRVRLIATFFITK